MSPHPARIERPSRIWISFSSITFGASFVLLGGGIVALPLDWTLRGWLMAGVVVMAWSSFLFAGTVLRSARSHQVAEPPMSAGRHLHHR